MNRDEYNKLFHRARVNEVAFKQVNDCDDELRKMVEMAIADEREECAKVANAWQTDVLNPQYHCDCATAIRARREK
jgi:hypothetical protein